MQGKVKFKECCLQTRDMNELQKSHFSYMPLRFAWASGVRNVVVISKHEPFSFFLLVISSDFSTPNYSWSIYVYGYLAWHRIQNFCVQETTFSKIIFNWQF